jgi:hypothetical protein
VTTQTNRVQDLALLGQGYQLIEDALSKVPSGALDFKPAPEKWSVREVIVHLADSEANAFVRLRKIIAENGSTITVYDQDQWAQELHYAKLNLEDALELFRLLRQANVQALNAAPEIVWATHAVNHPEKGSYTLDDWLKTYSAHIPNHVRQIERNVEAWQKHAAR